MGAKILMVKVGQSIPANVKDYQGVYIEARKGGRDNPNLVALFDAAKAGGVKVGWYIVLDPGERETYAVQLRELGGVLNNRPGDISPAVVVESIGGRTPHQFRGDFTNYFKTFTDVHQRVLLGVNPAVKAQITNKAGDTEEDYNDFWKIMSNGDRCRLWLWQFAGTPNPAPWVQYHLLSTGATAHEWRGDMAQFYKDNNLTVPPVVTPPPAKLTGQLLIDIWEGNPSLDFQTLKAAGVKGCIIRLNDMNGGHHMDEEFTDNWTFAQQFDVFGIYFVYNPWRTGKENYDWLTAHLPAGYNLRLFADVEVRYDGYSPDTYAAQVADFLTLCKAGGLAVTIYSGAWFKSYLSVWPVGTVDYWWAAYPTALTTCTTWEAYKAALAKLNFAAWTNTAPGGAASMWQCSGDKPVSLPGCGGHPVDVNLYPGSLDALRKWFGFSDTPAPEPTDAEKLAALWAWYKESHA